MPTKKTTASPRPGEAATTKTVNQNQCSTKPPAGVNGNGASPEAARAAFEAYLAHLPAAMQERYRKFDVAQITEQLSAAGTEPSLEALLPPLRFTDSADLLIREFPPLAWIVPEYLPVGLTFLTGKPKVGKSWLAMQLALSKMTGGKMLGKDVERGKVLYLALEDNERRFNDRMKKQGWPQLPGHVSVMWSEQFHDQIGSLNSGGGKRLMKFVEANGYRVLVVDTFSRAFTGDQLDSREMTDAIGPMQQAALKLDIGLIVIDHLRKSNGGGHDAINDLFGSVAKSGVMDTTWSLYKEQGKRGAKLAITGRDVDTTELKLDFDKTGFYWNCEGPAYEVEMTERRNETIEALKVLGEADAPTLAKEMGLDKENTRKRLNDLCNAGLVQSREMLGRVLFSANPKAR